MDWGLPGRRGEVLERKKSERKPRREVEERRKIMQGRIMQGIEG